MNARGFTLIEIIVTIILMAIMGFMAAQLSLPRPCAEAPKAPGRSKI